MHIIFYCKTFDEPTIYFNIKDFLITYTVNNNNGWTRQIAFPCQLSRNDCTDTSINYTRSDDNLFIMLEIEINLEQLANVIHEGGEIPNRDYIFDILRAFNRNSTIQNTLTEKKLSIFNPPFTSINREIIWNCETTNFPECLLCNSHRFIKIADKIVADCKNNTFISTCDERTQKWHRRIRTFSRVGSECAEVLSMMEGNTLIIATSIQAKCLIMGLSKKKIKHITSFKQLKQLTGQIIRQFDIIIISPHIISTLQTDEWLSSNITVFLKYKMLEIKQSKASVNVSGINSILSTPWTRVVLFGYSETCGKKMLKHSVKACTIIAEVFRKRVPVWAMGVDANLLKGGVEVIVKDKEICCYNVKQFSLTYKQMAMKYISSNWGWDICEIVADTNDVKKVKNLEPCPICFEDNKKILKARFQCDHYYCITCTKNILENKNELDFIKCPMCRANIINIDIISENLIENKSLICNNYLDTINELKLGGRTAFISNSPILCSFVGEYCNIKNMLLKNNVISTRNFSETFDVLKGPIIIEKSLIQDGLLLTTENFDNIVDIDFDFDFEMVATDKEDNFHLNTEEESDTYSNDDEEEESDYLTTIFIESAKEKKYYLGNVPLVKLFCNFNKSLGDLIP